MPTNAVLKVIFLFAVILVANTPALAQPSDTLGYSSEKEIAADISNVPCKNKERLDGVRKLFLAKGAASKDIRTEDFGHVKNLTVTKRGKSSETIVVGAHYDEAGRGCGAIDNWTGIVIITNLFQTVKDLKFQKTIKFVAFGKEEKGLIGSKAMVGAIPKRERTNYCAMINFDSFGLAYPQVMESISSKKLIALAEETAEALKMPLPKRPIKEGNSDSASFKNRKIPALGIHGLNDSWRHYLHSPRDQVENINLASVYSGYLFSVSILKTIDAEKCSAFR